MAGMMSHRRYALVLGVVFLLVWILLAIAPLDRHDWALDTTGLWRMPWWW